MNKRLRLAFEEADLEIDKAIEKQDLEDGDTSDALLAKVEDPPEDTTVPKEGETPDTPEEPKEEIKAAPDTIEQQEASAAVEGMFIALDNGLKACASLESIASILENTKEQGGMTPNTALMMRVATEGIYNDIGLSSSKISLEGFESYSSRLKVSQEAIEDIKAKIAQIWKMIISGIKTVIDFIRKAIKVYKSDMGKQKEELNNLKEIYRNIRNVEPMEEEIKGVLYQTLLSNNSQDNGSSDILALGKLSLAIMDSYLIAYRKDLMTAVAAINNVAEEMQKPETTVTKADIVKHGKIFGIHQTPELHKKPHIDGFKKTSNTISCYETDLMAGNVKFVSFSATEGNLQYEDIAESKTIMIAVERTNDSISGMKTSQEADFKRLFELIEEAIRISIKAYEIGDIFEKSTASILKKAEELEFVMSKMGDHVTNVERVKSQIYSQLTLSLQNFYSRPIQSVVRYNNRYVKALNAYCLASLKLYA